MASSQGQPRDRDPKSSRQSVPISVASKTESVEPGKGSDSPLSEAGVVPFKDLLYVQPHITLDSFAPPRSNHGLIFGAPPISTKRLSSTGAPSSFPTSSANANPSSRVDSKKPFADLLAYPNATSAQANPSSRVDSKISFTDLLAYSNATSAQANPSSRVDSKISFTDLLAYPNATSANTNPTSREDSKKPVADLLTYPTATSAQANPSSRVDTKKPFADLLTYPVLQPIRLQKRTRVSSFQPALKSSVAPPTLSPSIPEILLTVPVRTTSLHAPQRKLAAPNSTVNPTKNSNPAEPKRRVRFISVSEGSLVSPAKAAATSNPSGIPSGASFIDRVRNKPDDDKEVFFSESAGAILEYQRDTRFEPVDPQKPAPKKPNKVPDEVPGERSSFQKCNECETSDGAYTECEHIDEEPFDITVNEAQLGERTKPTPVQLSPAEVCLSEFRFHTNTFKVEDMLSARNISGLLTENVDRNASKYLMHTLHGTLLGYSDGMGILQARKIAALTGLTWRLKNESLMSRQGHDAITGAAMVLKVLQVTSNMHDGSLRQMVVEADGMWVAVCWVKQQVLVSAMIEKDPDLEEEKEQVTLADKAKSEITEGAALETKAKDTNDDNGSSPGAAVEGEVKDTNEGNGSGSGDSKEGRSNGDNSDKGMHEDTEATKDKERPTSPAHSWMSASTEEFSPSVMDEILGRNLPPVKMIPHEHEPSKLQILKWKAEGMAVVLKKDLKDFKMPAGGY